jgi:hypothetical protein
VIREISHLFDQSLIVLCEGCHDNLGTLFADFLGYFW